MGAIPRWGSTNILPRGGGAGGAMPRGGWRGGGAGEIPRGGGGSGDEIPVGHSGALALDKRKRPSAVDLRDELELLAA